MTEPIRPGIRRLFELATGRRDGEADQVAQEVADHIERRIEQLVAGGMDPGAARAEAIRRFGDADRALPELRRAAHRRGSRLRLRELLATWRADLRLAARRLATAPGFALVAVATLGLGIGATTAVFSVVHAVLLRPLPYPEPGRLAILWLNNQAEQIERDVTSYPNFLDWHAGTSFAGMAGFSGRAGTFTGEGEAEQYTGASVTAEFFRVLGVPAHLGRTLGQEHTRAGDDQVVVLSHQLWTTRFGGDPQVVGRTVLIDGITRSVAGIMPPGFAYPAGAQFWTPIAPEADSWQQLASARGSLWLSVIGRLGPGVTAAGASAELNTIMARLATEGQNPGGNGVFVESMQDTIVGAVRPGLLVLLGAVACVLLIACANVANLLLARGVARQRELAVRAALGASGGRLARLALAESLVLAMVGGVVGLLLAAGGTAALVAASPPEIPRLEHAGVNGAVAGFAALVTLGTVLVFGLAPVVQARSGVIAHALREGGRGAAGAALPRVRRALVTAEVALALVLLAGAGLLVRSFVVLQQVEPGFVTTGVLSFRVTAGPDRYPEAAQVRQFQESLLERIRAVPGVRAATGINTLLLGRLPSMGPVAIEGQPARPDGAPVVSVTSDFVEPSFFRVMEMPVVLGRGFEPVDREGAPMVVVVNQTFVDRFLPGEDPIGRRFTRGTPTDSSAVWQTIIGVVADSRRAGLAEPVRPEAFRPTTQVPIRSLQILVRSTGAPLDLVAPIRAALRELDPAMPMARLETLQQAMGEALATRRFVMLLLGGFAVLAVSLAAIGIYGVLAYLVGQRLRELGIRVALGAQRPAVLGLVLRQCLQQVLPGVAIGLLGAASLTRLLQSQLYGVRPADPATLAGVTLLLVGVALLASWLPARRAAAVSPMEALRAE